jgi:ferredoxin-type protein NapF
MGQSMLTRRQVLLGRFKAETPPAGPLLPAFGEFCLPRQGVVCRSCGEACAAAAIVFRPAKGGISRPDLLADRCTSCRDCVPVCPVSALSLIATPPIQHPAPEELNA